jgi:copper homeostasis protein
LKEHHPQLEICAETVQACVAAAQGGADRIEICSALSEGGVTPSHAFIREAIKAAQGLPVYVLLRPRAGHFVYSEEEFAIICADLKHADQLGAAGFVVGILTPLGSVDRERMRVIVSMAAGKEVTFHRAFDHTPNLRQALDDVMATGCRRVLTSGGKPSVKEGMAAIANLARQAAGRRIRIAAGGGVTAQLAHELHRIANLDFHASLQRERRSSIASSQDALWRNEIGPADISACDVREIAAILRAGYAGSGDDHA